ncbi:MAG: ferredoxin-type protein NapG [Epsilonproteobacteria bacterium]|nr:ferredoxin-type protein NapG [Campylobacterota bacterium]
MNHKQTKVKSYKQPLSKSRRGFLATTRNMGLAILGGLIWSAYVDEVKANKLLLRPPGALKEDEFLKTCIKCGLCVDACRNRNSNLIYDERGKRIGTKEPTLRLASPGDNKPLGNPFFIARENPCFMCDDIPCVPACPSGALDVLSVTNKKSKKLDINMAKMGLAVVHKESCIAYWGLQCDACYRACPLMGKALSIDMQMNKRTGKHAFLLPVVHSDICTGCGLCERACVVEKAAIFVLPREISMGRVGNHYVKGWDSKDEQRVEDANTIRTVTKRSQKKAIDKLNDLGGLLDE